jgi:hypothetical protein
MYEQQLTAHVAKVLTLMSAPPNPRERPLKHDLNGNFDLWFDGGAVKHDTGISTYSFDDGTRAQTGTSLRYVIDITLPGGRRISVTEND